MTDYSGRYENLRDQVDLCKPSTILEIGTWDGHHGAGMISVAQEHNPKITYYGFDLFEDITSERRQEEFTHTKDIAQFDAAYSILKETGAEIHLTRGDTLQTLPEFTPDKSIDFIYIDGGHSIETILSDWSNVQKLMHSETIVLFDDYYLNDKEKGCLSCISEIDRILYDCALLDPIDHISGMHIAVAKVTMK